MRWRQFTFTRGRIVQAALIVVVGVVGALLPYLRVVYENFASEVVEETKSLWPAAAWLRSLSIGYLPSAGTPEQVQRGIDLMNLGAHAHEVGLVIAVATVWGLFMDEINKFVWWGLHVGGWLLALATLPLLGGWLLLRRVDADVSVLVGWVPLLAAGVLAIVFTLRARSRLDTYAGV